MAAWREQKAGMVDRPSQEGPVCQPGESESLPVGNGKPLKCPKQGSSRTRCIFRKVKGHGQQQAGRMEGFSLLSARDGWVVTG